MLNATAVALDNFAVQRVPDVEARPVTNPDFIAEYRGDVYFRAEGTTVGMELYKSDGKTVNLVADINPGRTNHSQPELFTKFLGDLYFRASGPNGNELYRTDGVSVQEVVDLAPGPADSSPLKLFVFGNKLFFTATVSHGRELFVTDGTTTTEVADINPGSGSSDPSDFFVFNNQLFFTAFSGNSIKLYRTDGTTATRVDTLTNDFRPTTPMAAINGQLVMGGINQNGQNPGVFKSDGVTVTRISNVNAAAANNPFEKRFTEFQGALYFTGLAEFGSELYKTDGSTVTLVADINQGTTTTGNPAGSSPEQLTPFNNQIFFFASGPNGNELYKTDGTNVTPVVDLVPGPADGIRKGSAENQAVEVLGNTLYFRAFNGASGDEEVFKTDGVNVTLLADIRPGNQGSNPQDFFIFRNHLFFFAANLHGYELWATDGTTVKEFDVNPDGNGFSGGLTIVPVEATGEAFVAATGPPNGINSLHKITVSGSIQGTKFNDLDGDGSRDAGEPGLAGWTIYLDLDDDGVHDNGEPSTVTAADGQYAFTGLGPGVYVVGEVPQANWQQTSPNQGETTFQYRADTTWRSIGPVGSNEGQSINNVGLAWEATNTGWNTSLAYNDSDAAGWIHAMRNDPVGHPDNIWVDGNGLNGSTPAYFRKQILIPGTPTDGNVTLGVDDDIQLYVNGQLVFSDSNGLATDIFTHGITSALAPGVNLIAAKAHDQQGAEGWYATYTIRSNPRAGTHAIQLAEGQSVTGRDFGNRFVAAPEPAEIHGFKWDNQDGDGVWDTGEPGLNGWTIQLLQNGQVVAQTTTGDDPSTPETTEVGAYAFTNLAAGTYIVHEVLQDGWQQTFPGEGGEHQLVLSAGQIVSGTSGTAETPNFGNQLNPPPPPAEIHGFKWNDQDGDGVWDTGEAGLNGWTIQLVQDGQVVAQTTTGDDPTTAAVEVGAYAFTDLAAGTYSVREVVPQGWQQTFPGGAGEHQVILATSQIVAGAFGSAAVPNFGNRLIPPVGDAVIRGYKWNDLDGDGVWDEVEPALSGWTIQLVRDGQVVAETVTGDDPSTPKVEAGIYRFAGLTAGSYTVREVLQSGWRQTFPSSAAGHQLTLADHQVISGRVGGSRVPNFGNLLIPPSVTQKQKGNNGVGNGVDPPPPGNPPVNDGPGTSPGNPGNKGAAPASANGIGNSIVAKSSANDLAVEIALATAAKAKADKKSTPLTIGNSTGGLAPATIDLLMTQLGQLKSGK